MSSNKKWSISLLCLVLALLIGFGTVIIIIDPYFHYHAPLSFLEYPIHNERYQNDGIVKHFEYNGIITGTSMTQNFKVSEFDELFGVNSVKVSFAGASYREINENLKRAVRANPDIQIILRGLDYNALGYKKDDMLYDSVLYPLYLYDDKFYNDVRYILNKSVWFNDAYGVIEYTKAGNETTDFDSYNNWNAHYAFGKEAVDATYSRNERSDEIVRMTDDDYKNLHEHLRQNITLFVEKNPQINFYLFFTPYSIYYWDSLNQSGMLEKQLELEKETIKTLISYENIYLFSFFDEFEMICDLNNYKDIAHYGEDVNSQILLWMYSKEHMLTEENYQKYCDKIYEFYTTYDYDTLFR